MRPERNAVLYLLSSAEATTISSTKVLLFAGAMCLIGILFIAALVALISKGRPSKEWFLAERPASWPIVIKAKCKLMDPKNRSWVLVDVIFEEETITLKDAAGNTMVFLRLETHAGSLPPPYPSRPAAGLATPQQRIDLLHPTSWPIERHKGTKGSSWYRMGIKVLARRLELAKKGSVPDDNIPLLWGGTTFLAEQHDYQSKHQ